jgi:competence protein ComEC
LFGALTLLLQVFGVPRRARLALLAAALAGFVVLTGAQPSVLRAAVMAGAALALAAAGRPRAAPLDLLASAVVILIVADPFLVWTPGFELSVAATIGLLVLYPPIRSLLPGRPRRLFDAAGITLAAQAAVTPVLVLTTGRLSLVAVAANVLVVPAAAVASVWGFVACGGSVAVPAAAAILHLGTALPLAWVLAVAHRAARVPYAEVRFTGREAWLVAAGAVGVIVGVPRLRPPGARTVALLAVVVLLASMLAARSAPVGATHLVALDVGQGDALLVRVAGGHDVLVDGGPDPRLVLSRLSEQGVTRLDLVVLTHPHLDHVAGLAAVLRRYPVGAVLEGPDHSEIPEYIAFADEVRRRGVAHRLVGRGDRIEVGPALIDVLAPTHVASGTRSDHNNSSVVMRVRTPDGTVLLLGDAEVEEQSELFAAVGPEGVKADVLKVAHHGSAYQWPPLLAAVGARVAVVSVGAGNRYGHPSPALIDALVAAGAVVRRTDLDGTVTVELAPGGTVTVTTSRSSASAAPGAAEPAGGLSRSPP